ncbi:MAG: SIS domain-containing protein, partial [Acidimicrobiales bacterium]
MCGIIAVLRRRNDQDPPDGGDIIGAIDEALASLRGDAGLHDRLRSAAERLGSADAALRGVPGARALLSDADLASAVEARATAVDDLLRQIERDLDAGKADVAADAIEGVNAALVQAKDALWALWRDRLRTGIAVRDLAGPEAGPAAVAGYLSVQLALSALDRLEVRGRDSAGLHLLVENPAVDLDSPEVTAEIDRRSVPLFTMGAVRRVAGRLSFVYKAAAEIGELGDNTAALRSAIRDDDLLRRALSGDNSELTVLGHTRWASVGIISEANAHPLNSEEDAGEVGPYLVAALNGDVDNYAELRAEAGLRIPSDITTDAKVIPTLVSRRQQHGKPLTDAFRETVATFDGSVAIGASSADDPSTLHLALRGSGQALYVGLADDAFVVASEPYGVVEVTDTYLRMDGESATGRDGSSGQVVVLDRDGAGAVDGITRMAYDGTDLPVTTTDLTTAEITTRDIDRKGFPHFLLKEVSEAPQSMRKTLRGKVVERDGLLAVALPDQTVPAGLAERLAAGEIRRILAIGQGTAAVAGQALAAVFSDAFFGSGVVVEAIPATELSGFGLVDDMSDTLVVAISQSGTTTDTNRTVDLVRSRGAAIIGIVNRRNSDLVEKAHGVLYTS